MTGCVLALDANQLPFPGTTLVITIGLLQVFEADLHNAGFQGLLLHSIRRPGKANKKEHDRQQQHDIAPGRPAVIVAAIMAVLMFVVTIVIVK